MFNFLKNYFLFLFIAVLFTAGAGISLAQFEFGGRDAVSFDVSPDNPRAHQTVTVKAVSYMVDLDRASQITWFLDGEVIARSAGIKEIQFQTGELGSRSVIDVVVNGTKVGTVSSSITIIPTEVDILWEADTYVPPFYSGKAMPASDADITLAAIPQFVNSSGRKISSSELIFSWKKDGKVLGGQSGRGRDTITIAGPKTSITTIVRVEVSSIDRTLNGKSAIGISPVSPKIVFYENDPILGMRYEMAIKDTLTLSQEEINITAHPYFFSGSRRVIPDFDYSWRVNGSEVSASPEDESSVVLRQVGAGGEASVSLDIQNLDRILQSARKGFSIIFGGISKDTPFNF